jgi:ABC-type bacteriocin/lantibiotic exporter with double-glycine peptidase domain
MAHSPKTKESPASSEAVQSDVPTLGEAFRQFKRLVRLIRPYWRQLLKGMAIGPVVGILGMITPYLTKLLIDEVYPSQDVALMHVLVGGVLGVGLATAVMRAVQNYYNLYVNTKLSNATRLLFFNHLQHLKVDFFDKHRVGEIMSRFQDVGSALQSVNKVFRTVTVQGVYLFLVPPFLFYLSWRLALAALVAIPLSILVTALAGRALRTYWKATSEAFADLNALQVESLSQIRMLKTLALEPHVFSQANDQMEHAMEMKLKAGGLGAMVGMLNGVLGGVNTALFTWLGWTYIIAGDMTLGSYIAFTSYIGYLYNPLRQFVQLYSDFQQSAVNLRRMFEYLEKDTEQPPEAAYEPHKEIRTRIRGQIEIENVSFGYTDELVLRDVSLSIPQGTTIAVVGASGSGKTSLLRLLTGMASPREGTIRFDGQRISDISLPDLRRQLGVVWQEFSLMKGTIWTNLTIGMEDPDEREVDRVTRLCQIHELIQSSKNGYHTPVAEFGASLSGGQQQRIALARALLRDAPVLLLDEVTANIDVQTEAAILNDLFDSLRDRTVLFVTHRVESAGRADLICALKDGHVQGVGTHEELMESCTYYQDLHNASAGAPSPSGDGASPGTQIGAVSNS